MKRALTLTTAFALMTACSSSNGGGFPPSSTIPMVPQANTEALAYAPGVKIKHVIVLIQENRTVDNLFNGFPGADTVKSGKTHTGATVALKPIPFEEPWDPDHSHQGWVTDFDHGKMDGFDVPATSPAGPADFNYSYVPQAETIPYFALAKQFTFADRNFSSETGPSYPGHQYLIAGQSDYAIGDPNDPLYRWTCDAAPGTTTPTLNAQGDVVNGPFPCYNYLHAGGFDGSQACDVALLHRTRGEGIRRGSATVRCDSAHSLRR